MTYSKAVNHVLERYTTGDVVSGANRDIEWSTQPRNVTSVQLTGAPQMRRLRLLQV